MSDFKWDDSLSVGVDLIDEQHKMLIEKLGDLSEALKKSVEHNEILKTLEFMIDYTDFHFTAEEKAMAEHDYPGLGFQQRQHAEFTDTLNNILEDFKEEGPTKSIATSVNVFLLNWLINHIKGVDLQLGKFLTEKESA